MQIYFTVLLEGSSIARLFREQIRRITVRTENEALTNKSFTDVIARILAICTNLSYLNVNQRKEGNCAKLSLRDRSWNICCSSHLRTLLINVVTFDDYLSLLDDHLEQLSSFTVQVASITRSAVITIIK